MKRFYVDMCIPQEDLTGSDSGIMLIPLVLEKNPNYTLYFPVEDSIAKIINSILERDYSLEDIESMWEIGELDVIELVKTMHNSWRSIDHFLGGIIMRESFSEELGDYTLESNMVISSTADGNVESIVPINFIIAIILSALENISILITEGLLEKLNNEEDEENYKKKEEIKKQNLENEKLIDPKISKIARDIMNGKIK